MSKCRLIYKSVAELDTLSEDVLRPLVEASARDNRKRKITGLLLLLGDRFVQVLEGPATSVNALFRKIVADPRHRDVQIVSYESIAEPCFSDWSMEILDLNDLPRTPRQVLIGKYPSRDGSISVPNSLPMIYALLLDARAIRLTLD